MPQSRASPVPEAAGSVVFSPTEQCPSGRCSMSPSKSRAFQRQENRRAAARFIAAVTGVEVPAGDDDEFRRALADGVIVCRVLNAIQPETIPKVRLGAVGSSALERHCPCPCCAAAAVAPVPTWCGRLH